MPSKLLFIDSKWGKYDGHTRRSQDMVPIWPFKKKKSAKPTISRTNYMTNVVEYEKKTGKKENKKGDKNHLKTKKFLDAMKLLSKDKED